MFESTRLTNPFFFIHWIITTDTTPFLFFSHTLTTSVLDSILVVPSQQERQLQISLHSQRLTALMKVQS